MLRFKQRVAVLLLAVPGVLALFLPFTRGWSPLDLVRPIGKFLHASLVAGPAFLAVPIAVWQARRLFSSRLSAVEVALAYTLSAAAMVSVLTKITEMVGDLPKIRWSDFLGLLAIALCLGLVGANALLLVRNLRRRLPREAAAEVFLLCGYLPNAVFCLVLIGFDPELGLELGGYVVLTACIAYLVTIILLLTGEAN